jgi:hypothetical protein
VGMVSSLFSWVGAGEKCEVWTPGVPGLPMYYHERYGLRAETTPGGPTSTSLSGIKPATFLGADRVRR